MELKISIAATVLLAASYVGAATVPNTLVPGTPATAADMNANFQALADAVTAVEGAGSDFSGFGFGFSAAGTPKNVTVMVSPPGAVGGAANYSLRIFYEGDGSTDTVSIDGGSILRPFFAEFPDVSTDAGGNVTSVFNYIETPDLVDYITYNIEESTYDNLGQKLTVDADDRLESFVCNGGRIQFCLITNSLTNGTLKINSTRTQIRSITGPFTVNGIVFAEVRVENRLGNDRLRIRAKGIGPIFQSSSSPNSKSELIYYRVDGVTQGSLFLTPFASGGDLFNIFFSP